MVQVWNFGLVSEKLGFCLLENHTHCEFLSFKLTLNEYL